MGRSTLKLADYQGAAGELGCEVEAIQAVTQIEAPRGGFQADGQPVILFERHYFSRLTGGKYDQAHPDISNPKRGGYGPSSAQHGRLARAVALDRNAALKSASWGKFQIMGSNHAAAGHPTLQGFVDAMYASEQTQLAAFVSFIKADKRLLRAIQAKDWHNFAEVYNGAGQDSPPGVVDDYDYRIGQAYKALIAAKPDFSDVSARVI